MASLYLSLGTNLGDRRSNLETALALIGRRIGTVTGASDIIETEPWGYESPNRFMNMAARVETSLTPVQALEAAKKIETEMGRTAKTGKDGYKDRIIDIDLLLYDDLVMETPVLTIPHKLMHVRRFVLEPLAGIAPELEHPVLHKTINELLKEN